MRRVNDLKDIHEIFIEEKEQDMGATRKKTPEMLDKMIQFIWDYQQKNKGATPSMIQTAREVGINPSSTYYFFDLLVNEGRINKISSHPFRVTVTGHKDNTKAVQRFLKIRDLKEKAEAEERDRIRATQEAERVTETREADRQALFAAPADASEQDPLGATGATTTLPPQETKRSVARIEAEAYEEPPADVMDAFREAVAALPKAVTKRFNVKFEVQKPAMPQLIKTADTRDLVLELIERGYSISQR
jgi:hypothetical protein